MFACCQPLWSFALVADNASGTPLGTPLGNPPQFIVCAARELRWMLPWGLHWGLPWGLPRGITPNSFLRGTRCVRTILPRGLPKFICARCALCFGCSPGDSPGDSPSERCLRNHPRYFCASSVMVGFPGYSPGDSPGIYPGGDRSN